MRMPRNMPSRLTRGSAAGKVALVVSCLVLLGAVRYLKPETQFEIVEAEDGYHVRDEVYQDRDLAVKASRALISWCRFREPPRSEQRNRGEPARLLQDVIEADFDPGRKARFAKRLAELIDFYDDPASNSEKDNAIVFIWLQRVLEWCPMENVILRRETFLHLSGLCVHEGRVLYAFTFLARLLEESQQSIRAGRPVKCPVNLNPKVFARVYVKGVINELLLNGRRTSAGVTLYVLHSAAGLNEQALAVCAAEQLARIRVATGTVNPLQLPVGQFR